MGDDIEEEDIAYHAPGLEDVDVGGGEHAAGRNTDGSGEAHPSVQLQDVRMTLKVDWDDGTAPMASGERRPQDIDLTEYGPLLGEGVFSSEEAEERKRKEATRLKQQSKWCADAGGHVIPLILRKKNPLCFLSPHCDFRTFHGKCSRAIQILESVGCNDAAAQAVAR